MAGYSYSKNFGQTVAYLSDPANFVANPSKYAKRNIMFGLETAGTALHKTGINSLGIDLFFINASVTYNHGHYIGDIGVLGVEEEFDDYHGHLNASFGAHLGFGVPGVLSIGVSYMHSTTTLSVSAFVVNASVSYNNHGYWNESVGIGYSVGYGGASANIGYSWTFGHGGIHSGFNVVPSEEMWTTEAISIFVLMLNIRLCLT